MTVRAVPLKFSSDPDVSATLPGRYYFDPAVYEQEREAIWFKTWQLVGYRFDLVHPGDYITADVLDQKIFVCRAKDGRLRAFYNVCMHRGHTLLEGRGRRQLITCPFHAWTYDLAGTLKAAGNAENVAGFDSDDFALAEVKVETLANMVFVNLDRDAPSLASLTPGFEADLYATVPDLDRLTLARRDDYHIKSNWKFVFDALECYHCPVIHPEAARAIDFTRRELAETGIWQKHRTPIGPAARTGNEDLGRAYRVEANDPQNASNIWYLWPNLVFAAHWGRGNFKVLRAVPSGVETTYQYVDNFSASVPPTAEDIAGMDRFRDVAQAQDVRAMEQQQLGVKARGYRQGRLMVDRQHSWRSEHPTHHFQRMVWEALNGPNY